mmetsp:Transcript_32009/g.94184  ORF Transcript_32009/g.94184 Transcript_32009/m.94184 type:complete len:306 (+) Transcript_32009:1003-1920(+)
MSCSVRSTILLLAFLVTFLGETWGGASVFSACCFMLSRPPSASSFSANAAVARLASVSFIPATFFDEMDIDRRSLSFRSDSLRSIAFIMDVSASSSCGLAATSATVMTFVSLCGMAGLTVTPWNSSQDTLSLESAFSFAAAVFLVAIVSVECEIFISRPGGDCSCGDIGLPVDLAPAPTPGEKVSAGSTTCLALKNLSAGSFCLFSPFFAAVASAPASFSDSLSASESRPLRFPSESTGWRIDIGTCDKGPWPVAPLGDDKRGDDASKSHDIFRRLSPLVVDVVGGPVPTSPSSKLGSVNTDKIL